MVLHNAIKAVRLPNRAAEVPTANLRVCVAESAYWSTNSYVYVSCFFTDVGWPLSVGEVSSSVSPVGWSERTHKTEGDPQCPHAIRAVSREQKKEVFEFSKEYFGHA